MITAENVLNNLNCNTDWESQYQKDSAEKKLCPLIFNKICQQLGKKQETDQVITLGIWIPTVFALILFNKNGLVGIYMHSQHLP